MWKLVPLSPTPEMMDAARHVCNERRIEHNVSRNSLDKIFHAMLAAAPEPPESVLSDIAHELQCCSDALIDTSIELELLRSALNVPIEPHQTYGERCLEAAAGKPVPKLNTWMLATLKRWRKHGR